MKSSSRRADHVRVSFYFPEKTTNQTRRHCRASGPRIWRRFARDVSGTLLPGASSREMYGKVQAVRRWRRPLWPRSPYAVAMFTPTGATVNYRASTACTPQTAILSPRKPAPWRTSVTRKITRAVARDQEGPNRRNSTLGNLDAKLDLGLGRRNMWRALAHCSQQAGTMTTCWPPRRPPV